MSWVYTRKKKFFKVISSRHVSYIMVHSINMRGARHTESVAVRMAYKPSHIVTNDPVFYIKLAKSVHYESGSEDYTEEEGLHWHYHVHWPINQATGALSPTRSGLIRKWRRDVNLLWQDGKQRCPECYNKAYGTKCPACGLFYKIIWCQSEEHHQNVHRYIQDKLDRHPEWAVPELEAY